MSTINETAAGAGVGIEGQFEGNSDIQMENTVLNPRAPSNDFNQTREQVYRTRKHLIGRSIFTALFITMLLVLTLVKNDKISYLAEGECLRDYTFVWTEKINTFFVENTSWKDFLIIQSSIGIDFMMFSYLVIFFCWGGTMRIAGALILFYPIRNVIQTVFLMGRPVGFLWSYPGIISLTVPYFDTNDFYFSGHVGSTTIFASEYLAMKWHKMAAIIIFVIVDVWVSLTFLRTHYIIDFTTGYVYGRFVHRYGEKISYLPDVKLLGWPRQKRTSHNYDPCPKCGWGNQALLRVTTQDDIDLQKKVFKFTQSLLQKRNITNERSPLMKPSLVSTVTTSSAKGQLRTLEVLFAPSINEMDQTEQAMKLVKNDEVQDINNNSNY